MDEEENLSDSDFGEDEDPDKIEVPGEFFLDFFLYDLDLQYLRTKEKFGATKSSI